MVNGNGAHLLNGVGAEGRDVRVVTDIEVYTDVRSVCFVTGLFMVFNVLLIFMTLVVVLFSVAKVYLRWITGRPLLRRLR